jgi:hypothetical protein
VTSYNRGTSGERGLAGPDRSHQRHRLAGGDGQVDAAQHVDVGTVVPEPDPLEPQRRPVLGRRRGARVEDRRRRVEDLEDAPGRAGCLLQDREQPAERDDRPDEPQVERQERDQLAQAQGAVRDRQHAPCGHRGQHQLRDAFQHRPEPAQRGELAHLRGAQPTRVAEEQAEHVTAAPVRLDHPDAEGRLLDRRGEIAGEVLRAPGVAAVAQFELPGRDDQRGHRRQHHQSEQEVQVHQQHEDDDGGDRVGDEEHEPEAEEPPQRGQVAGEAAHQLPGREPVVERHR